METRKQLSLIVADDHPSVCYGIRSILEDLDFIACIDEACDGKSVLELLQKKEYDIVLMDIRMPGMNGFEITFEIKKQYPNVKVIALSMHNEERYVIEMVEKGASGYLLKNANREVIIEAILSVSEGQTYFSKEISDSIITKLSQIEKNGTKGSGRHEENLREILYLLCHQKTSKEIADILFFSPRTVEQYRRQLTNKIGTKNIAGVIKYGIDQGIYDDDILKNKFSKKLK